MYKEIYYSNNTKLLKQIKNNHYVPYRIVNPRIKFVNGKRYYIDYWEQTMKVISTEYDDYNNMIGCYVKWDDGKYGMISNDPSINYDLILENDIEEIYKIKDIVNTDKLYKGAEIVYWFFIKNINCFHKKYRGFWKFVDTFSQHRISDNAMYKISGELVNGIYTKCKIVKQQ